MDEKNQFDPNRTPFSRPAPGYRYMRSIHGQITINEMTGVVEPIENGPGYPIEIPVEFLEQDQPFVHTCSPEKKDSGGMLLNRGCPAWSGCAIVQWFKDRKYRRPTNVILTKKGQIDSAPCFVAYCGVSPYGRPTSSVHMLLDGWSILKDRTTIPQKIRVNGEWQWVETEVPNLAPFYDEIKQKKAEEAAAPTPKRRGRPKKNQESAVA